MSMTKLRVFISAEFFNLREVRSELFRFIYDRGYEPVEHETSTIGWKAERSSAHSIEPDLERCHMLVHIIGGRLPTENQRQLETAITCNDIAMAQQLGKQVYIFVERDVLSEYRTWQLNKETHGVQYKSVDDVRVFQQIHEVFTLSGNVAVFAFTTARDIIEALNAHLAGLLIRCLSREGVASGLKSGSERAYKLVFICHAKEDKAHARMLSRQLSLMGFDTWLDEERLLPGQDWEREIEIALKSAFAVIVCLSRGSVSKTGYVQRELRFALEAALRMPPGAIFIIPCLIDSVGLPDNISHWHAVDLSSPEALQKIERALDAGRATVKA